MLLLLLVGLFSIQCNNGGGSSNNEQLPEGNQGGDAEACTNLCVGAGFDSGTEENFGGEVIECLCAGSGTGIAQDDCSDYCSGFDVAPENSFLSTEFSANDKCVCDGTN